MTHTTITTADLVTALERIEMLTATGTGLDPDATMQVHLLAGIGRATHDDVGREMTITIKPDMGDVRAMLDKAEADWQHLNTIAATIRVNTLRHGGTHDQADAFIRGDADFIEWLAERVQPAPEWSTTPEGRDYAAARDALDRTVAELIAERAKTARLVVAAAALRSDMLNRAEIGVSNGVRIQNVKGVGRTAWHDFCAAIDAIAAYEVGK